MRLISHSPSGVFSLENPLFADHRGFFSQMWQEEALSEAAGQSIHFVQANLSYSRGNVLRGVHFQNPHPQGKLITCLTGEIFDVAVDLRQDSPTFLQCCAVTLSADRDRADGVQRQFYIPAGFGHGFYVTGSEALVLYHCTCAWHPDSEHTVSFKDPDLHIAWPVPEGIQPVLSDKDLQAPSLQQLRSAKALF